jgi:DNA ligase-1
MNNVKALCGHKAIRVREKLQTYKGKLAKEEYFFAQIQDDSDLKEIVRLTYDPFIRFGISTVTSMKILEVVNDEHMLDGNDFTDGTWQLIDDVASNMLTGNAMIDAIVSHMKQLSKPAADALMYIFDKKSFDGIGKTTINKKMPGLLDVFDVMLAHKLDVKKVTFPVAVEPKLDGVRVIALRKDGKITYHSREGLEFTSLANLDAEMETVFDFLQLSIDGDIFIDGEVTVLDSFKETVSGVKKKNVTVENPIFHMFAFCDAACLKNRGTGLSYEVIRGVLKQLHIRHEFQRVKVNPSYSANTEEEIYQIYGKSRDMGLEGVIVKNYNAQYQCKRDNGWMKIKDKQTVDVLVLDVLEGEGRLVGSTGKLVVDYNGVAVKVGSGLTDSLRTEFWHNPDSIIDKIIEVSFHEETPDKSLRHPVFECIRIDKTVPNTIS